MREVAAWAETGSMTAVQGGGRETVMHGEVEALLEETGTFSSSSAITLDYNDGGEEEMEEEEGEAIIITSSDESDDPITKEGGVIPGSPC